MDIHKNARLTPFGRARMVNMVLGGQTPKAASEAVGVCSRTVRKGSNASRLKAWPACATAAPIPDHLRQPTPKAIVDRIEALRRQRLTGKAVVAGTGVSAATVSRILKHLGLNRLSASSRLSRYQRERPGEPIHIDIKKLGRFDRTGHRITGRQTGIATSRGSGWEFVHACPEWSRGGHHRRCVPHRLQPDHEDRAQCLWATAPQAHLYEALRPGWRRATHQHSRA
jgi:hypothetical protein